MPGATLAELIDRTRRYADMVNSAFRSDTDIADLINVEWGELYDLLVGSFEDFFEASHDLTMVAGDGSYDLSAATAGVKKLRGVSLILSDEEGDEEPLEPFMWGDRGKWRNAPRLVYGVGTLPRYCLKAETLHLRPLPDAGATVRVYYVPRRLKLVESGAVAGVSIANLPNVVEPGWEDFICRGAAAKLLMDEQNPDAPLQMQEKERIRARVIEACAPRDEEAPRAGLLRADYGED